MSSCIFQAHLSTSSWLDLMTCFLCSCKKGKEEGDWQYRGDACKWGAWKLAQSLAHSRVLAFQNPGTFSFGKCNPRYDALASKVLILGSCPVFAYMALKHLYQPNEAQNRWDIVKCKFSFSSWWIALFASSKKLFFPCKLYFSTWQV